MEKSGTNSIAKSLREEWDSLTDFGADRLATRKLMATLFPAIDKLENKEISPKINCCQSVSDERRGQIYRDRIFNEHVTSGLLLDQPMAHLIFEANQNNDGLRTLAAKIVEDGEQFDHFYFLREASLENDRSCPLLSSIFEHLRKNDRRGAKLDQYRLGPLSQKILLETRGSRDEFFEWAKCETLKCLPNHLTLAANLIEYILPSNIAAQKCVDVRMLIATEMKNCFADAPVAKFVQSIDEESSDTLSWLFNENDQISQWLAPLLLRALQEFPEEMIPQVIELIAGIARVTYGDGRLKYTIEFKDKELNRFLGELGSKIVEELAGYQSRTSNWEFRNGSISPIDVRLAAKKFLEK